MRYTMAMRDRESGFTLLELIVIIAVIAILAAIALPSFLGESRKTKAFSEVQPMFNDMRVRLEQYLQENGSYPLTTGEVTPNPATPGTVRQAFMPVPTDWQPLRLRLSGTDSVFCSYTWSTGRADDDANISNQAKDPAPDGFAFATPSTEWYYLLARCDMDGDGTVFSWYFTSSTNPAILKLGEGN